MNETPAMLRVIKARINLLLKHPFFGQLALFLQLVEDPTIVLQGRPTMAVDGLCIYFHPAFVLARNFQDLVFVVAHEIMHCAMNHTTRRGNRDPERWNIACDYAINSLLVEAGFKMPSDGLYDAKYKGMSAEQIYVKLPQSVSGMPRMDIIVDGKGEDGEASAAARAALEDKWKVQLVQAANAAKGQGKLPGGIARMVEEITAVKTDWRTRLRRFATERTKNDYSFQVLNRKHLAMGYFLPGLYSENIGTMAVVSDDSGSIGNTILNMFGGEIASIRDAVRPQRTIVMSCDAAVNHVEDLDEWAEFKLKSHGGGGTDFRPPFDWLEQRSIVPACLVYLTDMYGTFPKAEPDYPVLWCSISKGVKAPWGETLYVEE